MNEQLNRQFIVLHHQVFKRFDFGMRIAVAEIPGHGDVAINVQGGAGFDYPEIVDVDPVGATVLIEHNLTVVRMLCDRVIAMHLGAKIDDGLPDTVLANETVVRAYVGE